MSKKMMSKDTLTKKSNRIYSRREALAHVGKAVTLSAIAAAFGASLPATAMAGKKHVGEKCMTILYPNEDGVTFDFDYYEKKHMTLIMDLYGKSIRKFELRRGLPGPDGTKSTYVATITIWIGDMEAFAAAGAEHTQTLIDDVPNFTNTLPIAQMDEVFAIVTS